MRKPSQKPQKLIQTLKNFESNFVTYMTLQRRTLREGFCIF